MFPDAIYKDPIQPATALLESKYSLISTYSMEKPMNMTPMVKQLMKDAQTMTQLNPLSNFPSTETSVLSKFSRSLTNALLESTFSVCSDLSFILLVFSEHETSLCSSKAAQSFILHHSPPCNLPDKSVNDDNITVTHKSNT